MNREQLAGFIEVTFLEEIMNMFREKSQEYGSNIDGGGDAFHNFVQTSNKMKANQQINMSNINRELLTAMVLMDKHVVSIFTNLADTPDVRGKLKDLIIYSFISLAMLTEESERIILARMPSTDPSRMERVR